MLPARLELAIFGLLLEFQVHTGCMRPTLYRLSQGSIMWAEASQFLHST